jgi:phosphatidylserine decarboxylase
MSSPSTDRLIQAIDYLPQGALSRLWGQLARQTQPQPAIRLLKRAYARLTGMDMEEAALPIDAYPSLEALFVRQLRPGLRPIDADPRSIVSPVDGKLGQHGVVQAGELLQVKGRPYRLADLLQSRTDAATFEGGHYLTLYLAPPDYHRVHAPVAGEVERSVLIPGRLRPVFTRALHQFDALYTRNERLITYLGTALGPVAVVKVGATLVGRIRVAYDPQIWSNCPDQPTRTTRYNPTRPLDKGAELGTFELGSTVVLLLPPKSVALRPLAVGCRLRVGEPLAQQLR